MAITSLCAWTPKATSWRRPYRRTSRRSSKIGALRGGVRRVRAALAGAKRAWQEGGDEPKLYAQEEAALAVYLELTNAYQALDWDQVAMYANQICAALDSLPDWILAMKHFLIDEYQDFNPSEQQFLDNIAKQATSVVITGDDDQSLYGGRGADPEAIVALHSDPALEHVNLVYSWRCPSGILDHANRYLRWMRDDPRELQALSEAGQIEIRHFSSAEAEVDYLAKQLGGLVETLEEDAPLEDGVACLFPTRAVLHRYWRLFQDRTLPCTVPKLGQETPQEQRARVLLRLAHLRQQPLLERVVLSTFSSIKPKHVADVLEMLGRGCGCVADAVSTCADGDTWDEDASLAAEEYCGLIDGLTSQDPEQVALCLQTALGGSVDVPLDRVQTFLEAAQADLEGAVADFLRDVFHQPASGDTTGSCRAVELYTMVGAKGLTRRYVFLPGCEEMFLPRKAAGIDADEEKRLFYVAVTRAKELVVITAPCSRTADDPLCKGKLTRRRMCAFVSKLGVAIERVN